MKYTVIILCLVFSLAGINNISAQNPDSIYVQPPLLDSAYLNVNIFSLLSQRGVNGSEVTINQSRKIEEAVNFYILNADKRRINGYRIRIFFDNRQDARVKSEEIKNAFTEKYPDLGVYRTYTYPHFKVTVGDYRTKSEAMRKLRAVERDFPAAFIVREQINFPPL